MTRFLCEGLIGGGDGNRTRDFGEAHRRVTATLRRLGGVPRANTGFSNHRGLRGAASGDSLVPPSGIEPEPLGLQPSAQPCTPERVYERRARAWEARTRRPNHLSINSIVRERTHDSRSAGDQQFTEKEKSAETKKAAV